MRFYPLNLAAMLVVICLYFASCTTVGMIMVKESSQLKVEVLRVWKIEQFQGEAILAGVKPRFVIALLIRDSAKPYRQGDSKVNFMAHQVAFFAVDSIIKLFLESEIEGRQYDLTLETEIFNERKLHFLRLTSLDQVGDQ